ncbi:MAG: flagellar filament capping protein FliD [Limisphaerales bacterium]
MASSVSSSPSTNTVTQIGLLPSTTTTPSLAISGLASGMDWQSIVQELAAAERAPETQWEQQETTINNQDDAFVTIQGDLTSLQTDLQTLQSPSLYTNTTAQSSDSTVASATAQQGTSVGTYTFNISKLATASQLNGQIGVSTILAPGGDLSNVTIGTAGFSTPITAGTFTVNGAQVTIAATDSLQQVFTAISNATNGEVTASYDSTQGDPNYDEITLTDNDGNNIVLGSAADTSNFLQVTGLYSNNSTSVTSLSALGHVQLSSAMTDSDLSTAVTGDSSGDGSFTINGVTINYNTQSDSIQDVLDKINSSAAGVTASYNTQNNQFVLTNNTTGSLGISMQDGANSNFLAATGLSTGTLAQGNNLLYTLNVSTQQLVSESNTIDGSSSNINGLAVTALATGSTTVSVSSDTSEISSAIQQFATDYNTVQAYITSQMTVTQNSDGSVTAGLLTGDQTANDIASQLRSTTFSADTAAAQAGSPVQSLADLGLATNGQNNTATLTTSTLDSMLTSNLNDVQSFFTDANGPLAQLNSYLNDTLGSTDSTTTGTLIQHEQTLSSESGSITTQISNLETKITSDTAQWTSEFEAMEQAEATANQELTYLNQQVTNGSL